MGHKEDLLAGAKKCLLELGYAKTTARDIVAASGTNLASIGYHFGSKEALMTQAIIEMLEDWGEHMEPPPITPDMAFDQRMAHLLAGLLEAVTLNRDLALASFENFVQIARTPALSSIVSEGQERGRWGLTNDLIDAGQPLDPATQRAVGSLMLAISTGVIAQVLIDPERAPTGEDLMAAFRYIAKALAPKE